MKKLIFLIATVLSIPWGASAQLEYRRTSFVSALPSGQTNTIVVDTRNTSGIALQVAFTGDAANTTTAIIGVTNAANAAFPQTLTIALAGTNHVYTWTNAPALLVTNLSVPATNIVITVTNYAIAASTNNTFKVSFNNRTNTFTWAVNRAKPSFIWTNSSAANGATNLWSTLNSFYPTRIITVAGSSVTINANAGDGQIWVGDTVGGTTNVVGSYFTVTNVATTNAMQLLTTNAIGWAATNIFNQLSSDFSGLLTVTQPSSGVISMVTAGGAGLTVSETGAWATNLLP